MTEIFVAEPPPLMSSEDGRILGEYLNRQMLAIATFVQSTKAGHAGLFLADPTDIVDKIITQTPTKVLGFDSKNPGEVASTATVATDSIRFSEAGLWQVAFNVVADIDYNSSNITREVIVYLHDDTDGVLIEPIGGGTIPRYGNFFSISATGLYRVSDAALEHEFSIYAQTLTTDSVTIEEIASMSFYVTRVSNYTYTGI